MTDTPLTSSTNGSAGPTDAANTGTPAAGDPVDGTPSLADPDAERERIVRFLADRVDEAGADGLVVNMSGGLDSTVTAALAAEAVGPDRVYALILPCNKVGEPHARDAEALAEALGIEFDTVHLHPLVGAFDAAAPDRFALQEDPMLSGNLTARLRMAMAYLAANATNALVVGTTNRSERLLGYLTKHGDGAADFLPIGHRYKSEVRELAAALSVPEFVREKPPSAGFLLGQRDADDLGAPYPVVDAVLHLSVDEGLDAAAVAERTGADRETVDRLLERYENGAHKRMQPPMPDAEH
ncbi:NAD+ synthase [Halorubrum gandharaense]